MQGDKYDVHFEDGRKIEVTVDGRDYLFYEQESGESSIDLITGGRMECWYKAAAAACRRQGIFEGTPEDFYEQVVFVLPVVKKKDEDPTTPPEGSEN
jgi:hypothetical protein